MPAGWTGYMRGYRKGRSIRWMRRDRGQVQQMSNNPVQWQGVCLSIQVSTVEL